ncbi:MAG: hypothetical protein GF334_10415, partial [Candidatus Altiarchaeales archaeon]|nr:hypothetical protein [Candidatus Altiarchaeales archaeon]
MQDITTMTREHANDIDAASVLWKGLPIETRQRLCRDGGCAACRFSHWERGEYGMPGEMICQLADGTEDIGDSDLFDNPDADEAAALDA